MAIDIKFFDPDTGEELINGINFGIERKGLESEVIPVVVKNLGTNDATGLYVKGSSLNSLTDVPQDEYNKQVLAGQWKWFSLLPNKNFQQVLNLPDIPANSTMIGQKEYIDNFSNAMTSNFANDSLSTHEWSWVDGRLKCTMSTGNFARVEANGWGTNLNFDTTYKMSIVPASTAGASLVFFGLRVDADGNGYMVTAKRVKTSTSDSIFFDMYHGQGVNSNGTMSVTKIGASTTSVPYVDLAPIRIKLINNANGNPEITIWYNNSATPLRWASGTDSWIDVNNLYPNEGTARIGLGVAGNYVTYPCTFEIDEASLLTDDPEGKVYIKTIIGDGAEDSTIYKSSMELFYDPII